MEVEGELHEERAEELPEESPAEPEEGKLSLPYESAAMRLAQLDTMLQLD